MKTLQIIPLLTLSALTGVSAVGQISYISQSRSITAGARVAEVHDYGTESAPDELQFDTSISATVEGGLGFAAAFAAQNSSLTPTGFSYGGATTATAYGVEFAGVAAGANSQFSIQFEVATPTAFSLQGGSGGGSETVSQRIARMDVLSPGFSLFGGAFDLAWGLGQSISLEGLLEPGITYSFTANLEALAEGFGDIPAFSGIQPARLDNSSSQAFQGGITFTAVSAVPESGTTVAGLAVGGLALWQWRRRRA